MNITVDVRMLNASGIGTYIRQVVPRIMKSQPAWRFLLLGDPKALSQTQGFNLPNASIIECKAPIYSLMEQTQLASRIPKDADLFWSPHYNIPLLFRGKLMVTIHDVFHLAMPGFTGGIHKRLYAKMMFNRLVRKAEAIICVSDFTKKELSRFTGGNEKKIRVIHQGVDAFWFGAPPEESPHPQPYFLCVGNIKPHKNLGRLLEAFSLIQNQVPHDLVLVGQKEGFLTGDPALLEKVRNFKNRVHFTGWVDQEKLKQYYAHAEAMLFPSLYEGFGLPPLEAMAAGCPVISSWAASLPEVCGGAVLYFDPMKPEQMASRILEMIQNPSLREEFRQKGLARADLFSWEKCAEETQKLMAETLNERNGRT